MEAPDFLKKTQIVKEYEHNLLIGKVKYFDVDEFCEIIDYYYFSQDLANAKQAVEQALSIHPDSWDILLRQARVWIEFKKYKQAIELINFLMAQEPTEPELYLLKGFAYLAQNQIREAEKHFNLMLDLAQDPEEEFAFLNDIAYIYFNKKLYSLAYRYYKRMYELNPKEYNLLHEMAYCLERQNRNKESQELYIEYLKHNPFVKTAWYNLGVVYTKLNEPYKALEAFDYALAIDPNFSSAIYNKAHIYYELKRYKESIEQYQKLLQLEHNSPAAYFFIAKNYIELKQYHKAIQFLRKALKRVPYFPQAWFEIGRILFLNNKFKKSKGFILKALRQGEIKPEYLKLLGQIYAKLGELTKAEKAFKMAALSNPFDDEIWHNYADVFVKQGDLGKAIDILLNGKDFITNKINYHLHLAHLYFKNGQPTQAKQHFIIAQNSDKNNTVANFMRTLIKQNDRFANFLSDPNVGAGAG